MTRQDRYTSRDLVSVSDLSDLTLRPVLPGRFPAQGGTHWMSAFA